VSVVSEQNQRVQVKLIGMFWQEINIEGIFVNLYPFVSPTAVFVLYHFFTVFILFSITID